MNYKKKYLKYKLKYLNIKKILGGSDSGYNTPSPNNSDEGEDDTVIGTPGSDASITDLRRYYDNLAIQELEIGDAELSKELIDLNYDLINKIQSIKSKRDRSIDLNLYEQQKIIKDLLLRGASPNVLLYEQTAINIARESENISDILDIFNIWMNSSQKRRELAKEYNDFDIIKMPTEWTRNYYDYPVSIRSILETIPEILIENRVDATDDLIELITNKYLETFI